MAEAPAPTEVVTAGSAETLSQLLARILNQLSLSSWLPSAALTLSLAVVLQLGVVLDGSSSTGGPRPSAGPAVSAALGRVADISAAGLVLLGVAVVVLTMLTQAFAFEAIRVLEGFWGTHRLGETAARWRCARHRAKRTRLRGELREAMEGIWAAAAAGIADEDQRRIDGGDRARFTPAMLNVVRARYLGKATKVRLTAKQEAVVAATDVEDYAPADLLRRLTNVNKRLADYPQDDVRVQPTLLGNVLRRHEDDSHDNDPGRRDVEMLVEEVFDQLPAGLQQAHDEQRGRLDLYCSMVMVCLSVAAVAVVRLGPAHAGWAAGAAAAGFLGAVVSYRAAVTSARYYGRLLVLIAQRTARAPAW